MNQQEKQYTDIFAQALQHPKAEEFYSEAKNKILEEINNANFFEDSFIQENLVSEPSFITIGDYHINYNPNNDNSLSNLRPILN